MLLEAASASASASDCMVMEAVAGGSARAAPARRLTRQGRPWDTPKVCTYLVYILCYRVDDEEGASQSQVP